MFSPFSWLKINSSLDCPIYCGKGFPNIMRICSHKMRESFPYQVGILSRNIWDKENIYFPDNG